MLVECKECGQMISDKAKACPKCGCPITLSDEQTETVQTTINVEDEQQNTGFEAEQKQNITSDNQSKEEAAHKTGYQTADPKYSAGTNYDFNKSSKDKVVAAVLALFLGAWGIHHFYLGNNDRGLRYLIVTVALSVVGWGVLGMITFGISFSLPMIMFVFCIIDMIHYLTDNDEHFRYRIETEKDYIWKKFIY